MELIVSTRNLSDPRALYRGSDFNDELSTMSLGRFSFSDVLYESRLVIQDYQKSFDIRFYIAYGQFPCLVIPIQTNQVCEQALGKAP